MNDQDILNDTLKFHGHRCWASVAGVRVGLAALRALDVKRSGGTQLYAIIETGEEHGGMCFGDGVQYTTGCTTCATVCTQDALEFPSRGFIRQLVRERKLLRHAKDELKANREKYDVALRQLEVPC